MNITSELSNVRLRYEVQYRKSIIDRYAEARGNVDNRQAFSMLWQCYAWAAVLGFLNDRRRPLDSPNDSAFPLSTVITNGSLVYKTLLCAAIAKSEEGVEILRNPKELAAIIEEYANGGFDHITELLKDKGESFFDNFNNMLIEVISRS